MCEHARDLHAGATSVPLVSIIVPFFGSTPAQAALLDETLSTVDAQTCSDYEVIIIDDGSVVDPAAVAREHPRTHVYRQANAGSASARNHGIAKARGDCFVFLDADDHLLPPALQAGLDQLQSHPGAEFVVGPREEMNFDGTPVSWQVAPPPPQTDLYLPLLGFEWYIIPPSSAMFRRRVTERVGGFRDPWGADDLDFYLRVARASAGWCFGSPPITRYRRYPTSSSRDGARMLESVRVVYERQRPWVAGDALAIAAFDRGLRCLTDIFLDCLVENVEDRLRRGDHDGALASARMLMREAPERWSRLRSTGNEAVRQLSHRLPSAPSL